MFIQHIRHRTCAWQWLKRARKCHNDLWNTRRPCPGERVVCVWEGNKVPLPLPIPFCVTRIICLFEVCLRVVCITCTFMPPRSLPNLKSKQNIKNINLRSRGAKRSLQKSKMSVLTQQLTGVKEMEKKTIEPKRRLIQLPQIVVVIASERERVICSSGWRLRVEVSSMEGGGLAGEKTYTWQRIVE